MDKPSPGPRWSSKRGLRIQLAAAIDPMTGRLRWQNNMPGAEIAPRTRGLGGRPHIDGWIWDRAADHRSTNSQLDRPQVVQLPYKAQLKSSGAVLPRAVSGRACIAGGQAEDLGGCAAAPGSPIGPDMPPIRLGLDPGGPDSLARGFSSRIAKRY